MSSDAGAHEVASPSVPPSGSVEVAVPQARPTCLQRLHNVASYDTPLVVKIRNRKVFFLHVAVQVLILAYIGIYGLWLKKGYQRTDEARGSSRVSVEGVAWSDGPLPWEGPTAQSQLLVWDALDLRSPPLETDALFVTSHMWMTRGQLRGSCVAFDDSNKCSESKPCVELKMTAAGRQMGGPDSCVYNSTDPKQPWPTPSGGFCRQWGWCPNELEPPPGSDIPQLKLMGVSNFTAHIQLDVHYPDLHQKLSLSADWTLDHMVRAAGWTWEAVYRTGGLFALQSRWDCDFDHPNPDVHCQPDIEFVRLDDPHSKLSSGFNFRTVDFLHGATGGRDMTKRYGFRLLILMEGVGAKADVVAALTSIGAGIGLLSVATLVADLISTKLLAAKHAITSAKYREVVVADAQQNTLLRALHLERIEAERDEQARRSRAASRATADAPPAGSQPAAGSTSVNLHERLLHTAASS